MSLLTLRKKSLKTWLFTDSVLGDSIVSKFYFSIDSLEFQIVEQGQSRRLRYAISDITLYDDTASGPAETFTDMVALSLRLEALSFPGFFYDGSIVAISNLIQQGSGISISGDGTLESPYIISATGGGGPGSAPTLPQVLAQGDRTIRLSDGDGETILEVADRTKFLYNADGDFILLPSGLFPANSELKIFNPGDVDLFSSPSDEQPNIYVNGNYVDEFTGFTLKAGTAVIKKVNSDPFSESWVVSYQVLDFSIDAIGLGNVNNTADADKPVSGPQATAISAAETNAKNYTDAVRVKTPARIAIDVNVSSLSGSQTFQSITLTTGDVVLLIAQTVQTQNGLWVVNGTGSWTRPQDFKTGLDVSFCIFHVLAGTNSGKTYTTGAGRIVGSTNISFQDISLTSNAPIVVSSNITATLDSIYTVTANATISDPTPVEGKGYSVFVRNGIVVLGGVSFVKGYLIYRNYLSGAWENTAYVDQSKISAVIQAELDDKDVLPVIFEKHANVPIFGGSALNNLEGVPFTVTGAVARNFSDDNVYKRRQRTGLVVSVTGNLAQARQLSTYFNRNSSVKFILGLGFAENCSDANVRAFAGLCANIIFTNQEPTALLNCFGISKLTSSSNVNLIHNDGSDTASSIDLGSNFPSNTVETDFYIMVGELKPSSIDYKIIRVNSGNVASGSVSSNIPSATQALNLGYYVVQSSGANTTTGIDFFGTNLIKR